MAPGNQTISSSASFDQLDTFSPKHVSHSKLFLRVGLGDSWREIFTSKDTHKARSGPAVTTELFETLLRVYSSFNFQVETCAKKRVERFGATKIGRRFFWVSISERNVATTKGFEHAFTCGRGWVESLECAFRKTLARRHARDSAGHL